MTEAPERQSPRLFGLAASLALVIAALVLLASLGNWQMSRLAWKEELIASVSQRPTLPALAWRDVEQRDLADAASFASDFGYRRIRLDGAYLPLKEARVFTSLPADSAKGPASGPGYWIMTPFQMADADATIWVNRGFVPEGSEWEPPPAGRVAVVGLIRPDDPPTWITPENKPERNLFFSRSVADLSEANQVALPGPQGAFTVDLLASPGAPALPQAGETRMTFTNNHLAYAVTWYGLAAALLAVFASFVWSRLRDAPQGPRLTPPGQAS